MTPKRCKPHNDNAGAAMIVVVCVLMIVMILCLTMVVGAYQTLSLVGNTGRDSAAYQQAYSFSEAMREQIETADEDFPSAPPTDLKELIADFATDDSLYQTADGQQVEEPQRALRADLSTAQGLSDLRLVLRKRKVSDEKCRLYLVTQVVEEDRLMSSCTAGYDVKLVGSGAEKKYDISFRGYY